MESEVRFRRQALPSQFHRLAKLRIDGPARPQV